MPEPCHKVLTKTAYEHLVAAVGEIREEGKMASQQADEYKILKRT